MSNRKYPRPELFQPTEEEILEVAKGLSSFSITELSPYKLYRIGDFLIVFDEKSGTLNIKNHTNDKNIFITPSSGNSVGVCSMKKE